ncbi:MAG: hypothetical protein JWN76_259 [Chitinophagaceae bacterium]|nr:hypothetical protein [Chitinophagaceae bacterium]
MDLTTFKQSLSGGKPPENISAYLQSLWYDGKGDWKKSHEVIQDIAGNNAAWIHAYLHRKEGDIWNADFWYNKAGKKRPDMTLEKEWEELVNAMLNEE